MFREGRADIHTDNVDEANNRLGKIHQSMTKKRTMLLSDSLHGRQIDVAKLAEMLAYYGETTDEWWELQEMYRQRIEWARQLEGLHESDFACGTSGPHMIARQNLIRTSSSKEMEYLRYLQARITETIAYKQRLVDEISKLERMLYVEQSKWDGDNAGINACKAELQRARECSDSQDDWLWLWSQQVVKTYARMLDPINI